MLPESPQLLRSVYAEDARGNFSKPFQSVMPGLEGFAIREIYWSTSDTGVIRGMHFQLPPTAIGKVVWVSRGAITDVVVDLRRGETYGAVSSYSMDSTSGASLWVPAGFAHGFQALGPDTIVNYAVDGDFSPEHDRGIRWDSVGFDWPLPPGPISARDQAQPTLAEFESPFSP